MKRVPALQCMNSPRHSSIRSVAATPRPESAHAHKQAHPNPRKMAGKQTQPMRDANGRKVYRMRKGWSVSGSRRYDVRARRVGAVGLLLGFFFRLALMVHSATTLPLFVDNMSVSGLYACSLTLLLAALSVRACINCRLGTGSTWARCKRGKGRSFSCYRRYGSADQMAPRCSPGQCQSSQPCTQYGFSFCRLRWRCICSVGAQQTVGLHALTKRVSTVPH